MVKLSVLLVLGEALLLTGLWMLLPALALVAAGGQLVADRIGAARMRLLDAILGRSTYSEQKASGASVLMTAFGSPTTKDPSVIHKLSCCVPELGRCLRGGAGSAGLVL